MVPTIQCEPNALAFFILALLSRSPRAEPSDTSIRANNGRMRSPVLRTVVPSFQFATTGPPHPAPGQKPTPKAAESSPPPCGVSGSLRTHWSYPVTGRILALASTQTVALHSFTVARTKAQPTRPRQPSCNVAALQFQIDAAPLPCFARLSTARREVPFSAR